MGETIVYLAAFSLHPGVQVVWGALVGLIATVPPVRARMRRSPRFRLGLIGGVCALLVLFMHPFLALGVTQFSIGETVELDPDQPEQSTALANAMTELWFRQMSPPLAHCYTGATACADADWVVLTFFQGKPGDSVAPYLLPLIALDDIVLVVVCAALMSWLGRAPAGRPSVA